MHRFVTPWPVRGPTRAFHVAAEARARLGIEDAWVSLRGDVLLADFERAALVAERHARTAPPGAPPLRAADLYAGALLEEVYHLVIARYLATVDPGAMLRAQARARTLLGGAFEGTLEAFLRRYPPPEVARGTPPALLLAREIDGVSGAQVALEEAWTCFLANSNPALSAARALFDLAPLRAEVPFDQLIDALRDHFLPAPGLPGRPDVNLFDLMLEPQQQHPFDLAGQLRFVRERWEAPLGHGFAVLLDRLLDAVASVREADVVRSSGGAGDAHHRHQGAPGADALRGGAAEGERFSPDGDWMPKVVMVAKSVYVWLDQLEREHRTEVRRLDQVPDAALRALAERGFNALWLIGVWERSRASQRIKQLRGQEDALASAYALYDYVVAFDLGGEGAFANLKARAAAFGIRMATDMVPNHVGIDGRWVMDHPERFVQLDHPPFPGYRFEGPNLSADPRVEVRIEDRYYEATDAAVVFERREVASGERRYLYHGNDGTLMPWNDTAQLDYLRADVREAVIQTILEVARRSPIIRFDAAMTLATRHVRRLWYPPPGEGGGVPSRGRYGALDEAAFEAALPKEFWREVVDRVAAEVPDTLLLAEAFWMLEGYFVRSLGMHRVYNSAFMHMLRDQDNAGYQALMREVLQFDPRILQRYVNFMNNPDEETARDQFGDGDRYFAVVTLLATLPGLPMFGHGQFEGLREKYGMEYRRAKRDEEPDAPVVARHLREISPILHRRQQFAGVEGFRLLEALDAAGTLCEDLFAYVNRGADATSLVLVNHRLERFDGVVRRSVPAVRDPGGPLLQSSLAEGLGLAGGVDHYLIAHDLRAGVTLVRPSEEIVRAGWACSLDGYQAQVWVDVHERRDVDGSLARLAAGAAYWGVVSLEEALADDRAAAADAAFSLLWTRWWGGAPTAECRAAWEGWCACIGVTGVGAPSSLDRERLHAAAPGLAPVLALAELVVGLPEPLGVWHRWRLEPLAAKLLQPWLGDGGAAWSEALTGVLAAGGEVPTEPVAERAWLASLADLGALQAALGVHTFEGVEWFSREGMERWWTLLMALAALRGVPQGVIASQQARQERRTEASGYRWQRWLRGGGREGPASKPEPAPQPTKPLGRLGRRGKRVRPRRR
jgi:glycosidase